MVEGLRSRTTRRTCHSWRPLPIASGVCFWFRRHRGCTKCRAGGRVCTYGLCRKCLCTRFEHAIHVLVALCHYARHCCSAVLSLYDRLCSLLSALLSLTRGRVTRVFCIPFCFSLSICFFGRWPIAVGAKLRRIYGKSTAMDASPTRASRPSTWSARNPIQILHDRHRQVLHDRYRYHRHNLHQRQDYDTATARRPSPWPEALRCDSGQCDRLVVSGSWSVASEYRIVH